MSDAVEPIRPARIGVVSAAVVAYAVGGWLIAYWIEQRLLERGAPEILLQRALWNGALCVAAWRLRAGSRWARIALSWAMAAALFRVPLLLLAPLLPVAFSRWAAIAPGQAAATLRALAPYLAFDAAVVAVLQTRPARAFCALTGF